jgi:hypothetical protein
MLNGYIINLYDNLMVNFIHVTKADFSIDASYVGPKIIWQDSSPGQNQGQNVRLCARYAQNLGGWGEFTRNQAMFAIYQRLSLWGAAR